MSLFSTLSRIYRSFASTYFDSCNEAFSTASAFTVDAYVDADLDAGDAVTVIFAKV